MIFGEVASRFRYQRAAYAQHDRQKVAGRNRDTRHSGPTAIHEADASAEPAGAIGAVDSAVTCVRVNARIVRHRFDRPMSALRAGQFASRNHSVGRVGGNRARRARHAMHRGSRTQNRVMVQPGGVAPIPVLPKRAPLTGSSTSGDGRGRCCGRIHHDGARLSGRL
jgi:hypothetical protein